MNFFKTEQRRLADRSLDCGSLPIECRASSHENYSEIFLYFFTRYHNVLILTTSNLTNAVDDAFLDRADIKQYVGPPSDVAIYKILYSCIKELQIVGRILFAHLFVRKY